MGIIIIIIIIIHRVSKNTCHFYFYDNFGKRGPRVPIFIIFITVKFRKDLRRKTEL